MKNPFANMIAAGLTLSLLITASGLWATDAMASIAKQGKRTAERGGTIHMEPASMAIGGVDGSDRSIETIESADEVRGLGGEAALERTLEPGAVRALFRQNRIGIPLVKDTGARNERSTFFQSLTGFREASSRGAQGVGRWLSRTFDLSAIGLGPDAALVPAMAGAPAYSPAREPSGRGLTLLNQAHGAAEIGEVRSAPPSPEGSTSSAAPQQKVFRPTAVMRMLGIAAYLTAMLPTGFGFMWLIDPNFHGQLISPFLSLAFLSVGIPLFGFGIDVMRRLNLRKYPSQPGDVDNGWAEWTGMFLGGAGVLLGGLLIGFATGTASGVPMPMIAGIAMMAGFAATFFGLHSLSFKKTATNAATSWLGFAAYAAGVGVMLLGASTNAYPLMIGGVAILAVGTFGALFVDIVWRPIARLFSGDRSSEPRGAWISDATWSSIAANRKAVIWTSIGAGAALAFVSWLFQWSAFLTGFGPLLGVGAALLILRHAGRASKA